MLLLLRGNGSEDTVGETLLNTLQGLNPVALLLKLIEFCGAGNAGTAVPGMKKSFANRVSEAVMKCNEAKTMTGQRMVASFFVLTFLVVSHHCLP